MIPAFVAEGVPASEPRQLSTLVADLALPRDTIPLLALLRINEMGGFEEGIEIRGFVEPGTHGENVSYALKTIRYLSSSVSLFHLK